MNEEHKRISRKVFLWVLIFTLCTLSAFPGCSTGLFEKRVDKEKKWSCDKGADDAMMQDNYEDAISRHKRFLEKDPENALALYHLGYAYGQMGDRQKELSYYENAIALGFREDGIFFNLGMAYGGANQPEKSIHAFKQALEMNPNNADNHFGLAIAYLENGHRKGAEQAFLKAVKIDPGHMDARLYLSNLYEDMGALKKAAEQLQKILEIYPANERARKSLERVEQKRMKPKGH